MKGDTTLGKVVTPHSVGSSLSLSASEHSSPPSSAQSASASSPDSDEDAAWGLMDALYSQTARVSLEHANHNVDEEVSIRFALAEDLDGTAFGAHSNSSSLVSTPSIAQSEMEIPNFPPLSLALLRGESLPSSQDTAVPRTSEPISAGIREDREEALSGIVNRELFQDLLDAPMGLVRFKEWMNEEGLPGSRALLQFHQDARAYGNLVDEVQAVTQGMQATYFGSRTISLDTLPSMASQPSHCLPALSSASLGMHSAQTEAFDRLYAVEFKRFLAGKISEQAKARLEIFPSQHARGDLGEVFCVANPRLPDQPEEIVDSYKDQQQILKLFGFYVIPLRNANGGIDFFIGAQVDVSKGLTSRKAFEALTGMAQRDQKVAKLSTSKLAFSKELINSTEEYLHTRTVLRQISSSERPPSKARAASPLIPGTEAPPTPSPLKKQRWFANLKTRSIEHLSTTNVHANDGPPAKSVDQDLPIPVREHMATFSSVYSNLLVFTAEDRRISYVTPPLLALLGHSVRSPEDRLASSLIGTDLLDLFVAGNSADANAVRSSVRKVVDGRQTHSAFANIALAPTKRTANMPEEAIDGVSEDGRKFTRCLLHLTPLKDGDDITRSYVVVVG